MLGGGPAGAAASILLAAWGHPVRLFTRPPPGRGLAVSIPPSCARLFATIGVSDAIERAGFVRSTGNTVWWGGAPARVEPFAEGARGWQLDVELLSEVMLGRALAAGVHVERTTIAEFDVSGYSGDFVLDCTGRAGVIARRTGVRQFDDSPRTIALVGEWRAERWPVPDDSHTLIESYEDGWMWSLPIADGVRHIAAMIDPQRSELARGGSAADVYLAEINKTRVFRELVVNARLADGPRGFDASPYRASAYAGERWLLVGDAGSFIDPLSSAGVKKALASGWLAAIAVHTAIANPSMRVHAFEFFSAREHEIEQHLSRESRRFLAGAATGHHHPFWDERSDDGEAEDAADQDEIRRAFDELKARDSFRHRIGSAASVQPKPCIRGREIVFEPHLVSSRHPGGIRYVRNIDLVALVELASGTSHVPDLYDAYVRKAGSAPLPDFLFAVATAIAGGWLVSE